MVVDILELEKGNGELYMLNGNLDISLAYLRFSALTRVFMRDVYVSFGLTLLR